MCLSLSFYSIYGQLFLTSLFSVLLLTLYGWKKRELFWSSNILSVYLLLAWCTFSSSLGTYLGFRVVDLGLYHWLCIKKNWVYYIKLLEVLRNDLHPPPPNYGWNWHSPLDVCINIIGSRLFSLKEYFIFKKRFLPKLWTKWCSPFQVCINELVFFLKHGIFVREVMVWEPMD